MNKSDLKGKLYSFFVGNKKIGKKLSYEHLNLFPEEIRDLLYINNEYNITSDVSFHTLDVFLDYLLDASQIPKITIYNIHEYRSLSKEFNYITDYLYNDENEKLYQLSFLLNAKENDTSDKTAFEKYISQNLDFYLDTYPNEMYEIPFTRLYNIFFNKSRKLQDHDKAYKFIVSGDKKLSILIKSLDGTKLSEEILKDAISCNNSHFEFIPQNSLSYVDKFEKKISSNFIYFNQSIDEFKNKICKKQEIYSDSLDNLKKEIETLKEKVNSLNCENHELKKQLIKDEQKSDEQLISSLNCLPIKLQLNMISNIIENSTNIYTNLFFSKVNNFIHFLIQNKIILDEVSFEFYLNKTSFITDKFTICIPNSTTKLILTSKLYKSKEFQVQIKQFEKVCFEIKYPDESYKSVINMLSTMKYLLNDCLIIFGVFITGVKETDLTFCNKTDILYVKLDSDVTFIANNSFKGCKSLERISIPCSINSIGENAFGKCPLLQQISIPYLVTKINRGLFNSCTNLKIIAIPPSVTEIESLAFKCCSSIEQIVIPSSVTLIGDQAFAECKSLTRIIIPNSVREIGNKAFQNCCSLKNAQIHSDLNIIEKFLFDGCIKLDHFVIPFSVIVIKKCAFRFCRKLKDIDIPRQVTLIEDNVFYGCSSLKNIKISPPV